MLKSMDTREAGFPCGVDVPQCPRELRGHEMSWLALHSVNRPVNPSEEKPQWQHAAPAWSQSFVAALGQRWEGREAEEAQAVVYSRWMSIVTEVSLPLGMALLVARHTMLSPFSMSEGAMNRVLMMLSLLPSRRRVCQGETGVRRGLSCWRGALSPSPGSIRAKQLPAITIPPAGICQKP